MDLKVKIRECKKGKTESFKYIVEAFQDYIYSIVFRIVADQSEAQDITQDTFLKFWKTINRFDENLPIQPYLKKIAVNLCYDQLKANERRLNKHNAHEFLREKESDTLEHSLINKDQIHFVMKFMEQLSSKQRMVFMLSDVEGNSLKEITEMLHMTYEQVKSNLYYARRKMRESLIKINV